MELTDADRRYLLALVQADVARATLVELLAPNMGEMTTTAKALIAHKTTLAEQLRTWP